MQRFAQLFTTLSNTTKTNDKRELLQGYLQEADDSDKLWLIALFTGRRPRRLVNSTLMKQWCVEETGIPFWLFDESYHTVGDLSEAIALLLESHSARQDQRIEDPSLTEMMRQFLVLQNASEAERRAFITQEWRELSRDACIVFNKLIMGGFRIGVSEALVVQALAAYLQKDPQAVAHLLAGAWDPYTIDFQELVDADVQVTDLSKPYPFYLAYPLESGLESLGAPGDWQVEWKWDGIRGQLIKRGGNLYLWSRGEELITDKFPEIQSLIDALPEGIVLDGEVLAYRDGLPISFQYLQTRITRKTVSKKQLQEAPTVFMAYDMLELNGEDLRPLQQSERRRLLEDIAGRIHSPHLVLSQLVSFHSWEELSAQMEEARERATEGFMIKRKSAHYQAGRRRGDWWKLKVDPLSVDAVLIYAQKGSGKRSGLYTDYTFAVRGDDGAFVPFAKAYSGLTDKEIAQVDRWVKANSIEQFGPVRTVKPELVFEIGFEGISASSRHKSGVAVRFPRMLKWRTDKTAAEIDTLDTLREMLEKYGKMGNA
jgi:DNA ligase-1